MSNESLKLSHLRNASAVDSDDPIEAQGSAILVLAKALFAMAQKIDVLTAKLNADAGVTDTNYAVNFATTTDAISE